MSKVFNKVLINFFVIIPLVMLPVNVFAEQDTDITQLVKEFQVEDNPIDNLIINSNTNIVADGMDNLDNSLFTIFMEPSVSDNYDKICPFFEKNNFSGIQMFVDGQLIDFSKYDNVYPSKIDGRVLVPVRAIVENLGAKIEWIAEDKLIRIELNGKVVEIVMDSKTALVNGKKTTLDVPAKTIDGRILVPARFISESFSKIVEWHGYSKELGIIAIY